MPITLYGTAGSPPCRAILIVADALRLPIKNKNIDVAKGDHLTEEYLKNNPLHTIPTLDDNGTILVDSHAILSYLVSKYVKDDSLYPKDLVKRALVDAKLHFDTGYAFDALRRSFRAHLFDGQKEPLTAKQIQEIQDVYDFMNTFLQSNKWLVSDSVTIADISLFSTVTSLETMLPIDNDKYPNLRRWLNDAETVPFFKANKTGLEEYRSSWMAIINNK